MRCHDRNFQAAPFHQLRECLALTSADFDRPHREGFAPNARPSHAPSVALQKPCSTAARFVESLSCKTRSECPGESSNLAVDALCAKQPVDILSCLANARSTKTGYMPMTLILTRWRLKVHIHLAVTVSPSQRRLDFEAPRAFLIQFSGVL